MKRVTCCAAHRARRTLSSLAMRRQGHLAACTVRQQRPNLSQWRRRWWILWTRWTAWNRRHRGCSSPTRDSAAITATSRRCARPATRRCWVVATRAAITPICRRRRTFRRRCHRPRINQLHRPHRPEPNSCAGPAPSVRPSSTRWRSAKGRARRASDSASSVDEV